jgi:ubiquinone/menaquinone biosynthesis C-methylase UbiE
MRLDSSSVKEIVRRHWSNRAAEFDAGMTHGLHSAAQRAAWVTRLERWAGPAPLDALDVGCGTGFLALLLAGLGHRTTGVDVSSEMLALARGKAAATGLGVHFDQADAERLPFEAGSFDLLVERHVVWTLPAPGDALTDWRRVLRPGGRLVLVEGDWRTGAERRTDEYAQIRDALPLFGGRPSAQLAALVAAAGLNPVTVEPLMDSALWGGAPEAERYAVLATRPD